MKCRLGELSKIYTGRLDANAASADGVYPFFTCSAEPLRINEWRYDCECVLVAGNCNPYVSYYKGKFNAYQRVYIIEPQNGDLLDVKHLYYYLKLYMAKSVDRQHGAIEKFFHLSDFTEIILDLPNIEEQRQISNALYSLDRKIALNRKKIATLEKMAKEIYDYWFVQYDFPDATGRPYKSSGGEMVYSPELKREIPKGWRVEQIGNHITSNRGISYSSKDIKTGKGVPMINLNSFNVDSSYKVKGIKTFEGEVPSSKRLSPFDLVMCNTQQTDLDPSKDIIGKTFLIPDIFDSPIVSSHHVTTIHVDDDDLKVYLNALFHTHEFHAYISGYTSGTSIRGLNFSGVENCFMAIPPKTLLSRFAKIGLAGEKKKSLIIRDQEMVQNLRDFLLPLLMNGQVKVG